jgi:hypothetical protein
MTELKLRAVLEPRGPAAAIVLSDDQVTALGGGKTPPVRLTIGAVTVAARVGRMGGENLLGLSKKLRADLGVDIGQTVEAVIALDAEPRTMQVSPALAAALADDSVARAAFDRLAYSHQKEYARWVDEAKRDTTRQARVEQTLQRLRDGARPK